MKQRILSGFLSILLALAGCGILIGCTVSTPSSSVGIRSDQRIRAGHEVSVSGREGTYQAPIGSSGVYTVTVANTGLLADTYTIITQSRLGWADFQSVPAQITLTPDEQSSFPIAVTIPTTATAGMEEEIVVSAESRAIRNLGDDAITRLEIVP